MSDIWNEFEKIAVEQGLVSTAQDGERKQEDPAKMPARYDSISDDAIRLLYGVEPETIFEKDKTIVEIAHPETAVVGRAYDAMNAVVENLHQRQDMMAYIALKMPNGHLTQKRYVVAKQDLVNSLVRAAFLLENREESDLVALADSCTERLASDNSTIVKEALAPLAIVGIIAGAGALLGGAYYLFYGGTSIQNVYANAQQVLEALNPLASQPYTAGIRNDVTNLMRMAQQVYAVKSQLSQVRSVDVAVNATQAASHRAQVAAINTRIQRYVQQLNKVAMAIPQWVAKIQQQHSTSTQTQSDWWAKLQGVYQTFDQPDHVVLINKLHGSNGKGGFAGAIANDIRVMSASLAAGQQQVQQQAPQMPGIGAPIPAPTPAPGAPAALPGLPAPTPAPVPAAPGAARPSPRPPAGFGGLPQW